MWESPSVVFGTSFAWPNRRQLAATAVRLAATDRSAEPGMGPHEEER